MREKLKNVLNRLAMVTVAVVMAGSAMPQNLSKKVSMEIKVQAATTLSNPRAVEDSTMQSGQKVTWDCVWFGSYPQTEIVDRPETSGCYGKVWRQSSDWEVNEKLYNILQNATGWNSQGDIIIDGQKYRRLQESDCTYVCNHSPSQGQYYSWITSSTNQRFQYFRYEPIKWRILNISGGNRALLLADQALDNQQYNMEYNPVTWEKSTIRSWLNDIFFSTAFNTEQKLGISVTTIVNDDNIEYGTSGGNNTSDHIFLLSESEISNTEQAKESGFIKNFNLDEARQCKSSTYAKAMGAYIHYAGTTGLHVNNSEIYTGNCIWWLRTPGMQDYFVLSVYPTGGGWPVTEVNDRGDSAVRPALYLNLSDSSLYTYAGTVCSDGTYDEIPYERVCEHSLIKFDMKEATCTENGNIDYWKCAICNKYYSDNEAKNEIGEKDFVILSTGHKSVTDAEILPTCTTTGKTEGSHCSVCNEILMAQKEINRLDHSWDKGTVTKEPTSNEKGIRIYFCTKCGETKEEEIDELGENVIAGGHFSMDSPGDCEAIIKEGIWKITADGILIISGNGSIGLCGTEWYKINNDTHLATDAPWGMYHDQVKEIVVEEGITGLGARTFHGLSQVSKVTLPDSLESIGAQTFGNCNNISGLEIPSNVNVIKGNLLGNKDDIYYDSHLEKITFYGDFPVTIASNSFPVSITVYYYACNETWKTENAKSFIENNKQIQWISKHMTDKPSEVTNATCTKDGTSSFICDNCEELQTEIVDKALGHDYSEWKVIKVPGCTEKGSRSRICSRCENVETEDINAKGHVWEENVTVDYPATCTQEGSQSIHCKNCDETKEAETIPATGHQNKVLLNVKEANCSETGYTGDQYCKDCKEIIKKGEVIETKDHIFDNGIVKKKASCIAEGSKVYKCTTCGYEKTESIPKTGHSWETEPRIDVKPTCTKLGSQSIHCSLCDATKEEENLPKTAHEYGEGIVTKKATCTTSGIMTYHCQDCDASKEEKISALGHKWEDSPTIDQPASCTKAGSQSIHCQGCNMTKDEEIIPAQGHRYDDGKITKEPSCTEAGIQSRICDKCNDKETRTIDAKGHQNIELHDVKEVTCTAKGYTGDSYCEDCKTVIKMGKEIAETGHKWDAGVITTQATTTNEGVKTFTCSVCKQTRTESIAKLPENILTPDQAPASNPVSQDKSGTIGKDVSVVDQKMKNLRTEDVPGTVFQLLQMRCKSIKKTSLTIQWKKVKGATKYIVYGAKCGSPYKKLKSTTSLTFTQKKLKKGTYYKYFVIAVKGNKTMATSKTIHMATKGGKVGNDKKIALNKTKVSLKKGKTFIAKAKVTPYSKKLKVKKHRPIAFESSNPSIAKVGASSGKITGKKKGTCYVYAYAQDGIFAKIKVIVK